MRKRLLQADALLGSLSNQLPFSAVNPDNASRIRSRFLKKPFEPVFSYGDLPSCSPIIDSLASLRCGSWTYGRLLEQERLFLLKKAALTEAIGTPAFGKHSVSVYGLPSKALVDRAYELLTLDPVVEDAKMSYVSVRKLLAETFKKLGFRYAIRRKNMVASALLDNNKKVLHLCEKTRFSKTFAYRLATHEIATHALRAENGQLQKLSLFTRGTPEYLATEEGLAAYNEERAGVMTPNILRSYAGRVIAIHLSQTLSFTEVFSELSKFFPPKDSYTLTLRAKRGLAHGSDLGACTKDYLYLDGYFQIKKYVSNGGDLRDIYAAKISISEAKKLRSKLIPAKHIPEPVIEWVRHEQFFR